MRAVDSLEVEGIDSLKTEALGNVVVGLVGLLTTTTMCIPLSQSGILIFVGGSQCLLGTNPERSE